MDTVSRALQDLVNRALAVAPEGHFWLPFDPDWRSPCELDRRREAQGPQVGWRPAPQTIPVSFDGLANALDQPIHPEICAYFSQYWSGSLETQTQEGHVSLIGSSARRVARALTSRDTAGSPRGVKLNGAMKKLTAIFNPPIVD